MRLEEPPEGGAVAVGNPATAEFEVCRTSLLPSVSWVGLLMQGAGRHAFPAYCTLLDRRGLDCAAKWDSRILYSDLTILGRRRPLFLPPRLSRRWAPTRMRSCPSSCLRCAVQCVVSRRSHRQHVQSVI